jgi:hypothetical protein
MINNLTTSDVLKLFAESMTLFTILTVIAVYTLFPKGSESVFTASCTKVVNEISK